MRERDKRKWWHGQGEALHGCKADGDGASGGIGRAKPCMGHGGAWHSQLSSRPARHEAFRLSACAPPTHATRTCLRHHVLILESVPQPLCQRLIWDETRVIHTTALVVRPDVRPRKLPRRRVRQKDADKAIAIIHVVHGAEVFMRTDSHADIDWASSSAAGRRAVKLQHDL